MGAAGGKPPLRQHAQVRQACDKNHRRLADTEKQPFCRSIRHAPARAAGKVEFCPVTVVETESLQARCLLFVADAGGNAKREALDDGSAIWAGAGREHGFRLERTGIEPGDACRTTIGDENFAVIGNRAGDAWEFWQCRNVTPGVGIDHLDRAFRGMGDEDAAALRVEDAVIELAARGARYFDRAQSLQRHDDLMPLRACLCWMIPSMCNLPGKRRALHRAWTVEPPRAEPVVAPVVET